MSTTALELRRWAVSRGHGFAVGPVTLSADSGSILTIMGPSGIGKTTLLYSLLGWSSGDLTSSGERRLFGVTLSPGQVPDHALLIPQHVPFNPNWELEAFLLRLPWSREAPRRVRRTRVREVLESLALARRRRATASEMSGGEMQRAALAQVELLRPELLVGDEFVSGMDLGLATDVLGRCKQLIRGVDGIGVLSLHSAAAALLVSDQIVVLFPDGVGPVVLHDRSEMWHWEWVAAMVQVSRFAMRSEDASKLEPMIGVLREASLAHNGMAQPWARPPFAKVHADGVEALSSDELSAVQRSLPKAGLGRVHAFQAGEPGRCMIGIAVGDQEGAGHLLRVLAAEVRLHKGEWL